MSTLQAHTPTNKVINFPVIQLNKSYLIQLSDTFKKCEAEAFISKFEQLCKSQSNDMCIVLDCNKISLIDSKVIDVLLSSSKLAQEEGIKLVFWSITPQIRSALGSTFLSHSLVVDGGTEAFKPKKTSQKKSRFFAPSPVLRSKIKRRVKRLKNIIGRLTFLVAVGI